MYFLVVLWASAYKITSFIICGPGWFSVKMDKVGLMYSRQLTEIQRQEACGMEKGVGKEPWHPSSAIEALDPQTRKMRVVRVSARAIEAAVRRSRGARLECAELVPNVLQYPAHVWRGLRWDDDEMFSSGPGWLSYCKIPAYSYREDGAKQPPRPNRVFMVCVNMDGVVYNWWWVPCDPRNPEYPEQYDERFREQLL